MSNPYFQFKRFTVRHDRCAMKVGTDAVLLGSWMRADGARRLLDIGCGSGVIALMAAQRCQGRVCAVEIDPEAAEQARENVAGSPWPDRIRVVCTDIRTFDDGARFDVIFSNPPYFTESLKCPDNRRTVARHADTLDFDTLMRCAASLLTPDGEFSLVVPMSAVEAVKASATSALLHLSRETWVHTKAGVSPKRALLAFAPSAPDAEVEVHHLLLEQAPGEYSDEYKSMVREFYLYVD